MTLLLTALFALALLAALALLYARLAEGRLPAAPRRLSAVWGSADGLAAAASVLLAAAALALLPWPLHPAAGWSAVGSPALVWAAVEGAFLATLVPGMLAPSPFAARAAVREAQVSAAGRFVVWLALGAGLWAGAGWGAADLLGRALALLAGLLALPAALGVGPFAPEPSLSAAGAEEGLDEDAARLLRFARDARAAALTAALVVASLPLGRIAPQVALPIALAAFGVTAFGLGRVGADQPRVTLPAALRWCLWRALPLAAAGLVVLVAAGGSQ